MHFWCFTFLQRCPSSIFQNTSSQNLASIKNVINEKLKTVEKYALTKIMASFSEERQEFIFKVERSDCDVLTFLMKPNFLDIEVKKNGSAIVVEIINLKCYEFQKNLNNSFQEPFFNQDVLIEDFVEKIRIRCIKATKERTLNESVKMQYLNYLAKIENYAQGNKEKYEEAFDKIGGKFESKRKVLTNRISDLCALFNTVCRSDTVKISKDKNMRCITKLKTVYINTEWSSVPPAKRIKLDNDNKANNYYAKFETIEIDCPDKNLFLNWHKTKNLRNLVLKNWTPTKTFLSWNILKDGFQIWKRLNFLDLSNCRITDISSSVVEAISESLTILILSNNELEHLPVALKSLRNLKILNLSNNKRLCNIEWANGIPQSLKELYLENTNVEIIPSSISELKSLKIFVIAGENLKEISWNSFSANTLEELNIDAKGKTVNPLTDLRYLKNLRNLKLHYSNPPNNIFENISENLEMIDFSCGKVLYFNEFQAASFTMLSSLILPNNAIHTIDWENLHTCCPNLVLLNLENNHLLTRKVFALHKFKKLKILNLSKNKMTSVFCEKFSTTLEEFYASDNQITAIHSIERLAELKVLDLRNNEIDTLPAGIHDLHQLCFLSLANNRLTGLSKNFETLKSLKFLDLRQNNFYSKTQDLVQQLWERLPKNISTLKISGNYLSELPCQLANLPLDYLEAIDCNIRHICPKLRKSFNCQSDKNSNIFEADLLRNGDIKVLDLRENPDLKYLNFVPAKIFPPPSSKETFVNDVKSFEKSNFAIVTENNNIFQNTKKFPHRYGIPVYNFSKKLLTLQEKEQFCQCCSLCCCGGSNNEIAIIETLMVMDFYLINVGPQLTKMPEESIRILELPTKPEKPIKTYKRSSTWIRAQRNEKSIFDYELSNLLPEKWCTLVRTKMCENCIKERKNEIADFYSKIKNDSSATLTPNQNLEQQFSQQPCSTKHQTAPFVSNLCEPSNNFFDNTIYQPHVHPPIFNTSDSFYPQQSFQDIRTDHSSYANTSLNGYVYDDVPQRIKPSSQIFSGQTMNFSSEQQKMLDNPRQMGGEQGSEGDPPGGGMQVLEGFGGQRSLQQGYPQQHSHEQQGYLQLQQRQQFQGYLPQQNPRMQLQGYPHQQQTMPQNYGLQGFSPQPQNYGPQEGYQLQQEYGPQSYHQQQGTKVQQQGYQGDQLQQHYQQMQQCYPSKIPSTHGYPQHQQSHLGYPQQQSHGYVPPQMQQGHGQKFFPQQQNYGPQDIGSNILPFFSTSDGNTILL